MTSTVALITEGTYPTVTGGVSTWCDYLIRGLPELRFELVALTPHGGEEAVWPLPVNVSSLVVHGVWPRPDHRYRKVRHLEIRQRADRLLTDMWRAVLAPDTERAVTDMLQALFELTRLSGQVSLARLLRTEGSHRPLKTAWAERALETGWPELSVADAVRTAVVIDHALALIDLRIPGASILHATANGQCGLVGMVNHWRTGAGLMLSEHGVYLREQYTALRKTGESWQTRKALTAFIRRLSQSVYRESDLILPVNDFNRRWALELGARDDRIWPIHNGVPAERYRPLETEPAVPTLSFVGRIDPLKDLETMIRAHAVVLESVPGTQLRLFGPVPKGNEAYFRHLRAVVQELGTSDSVHWEGPVAGSLPAIEAGTAVVLSSISEGLPYALIEAMMCGRPTVSTDVGGVPECLDPRRRAGMLVPPRNPFAMARACVELLTNPDLRRRMGKAAAQRARELFATDHFVDRYRTAYGVVAGRLAVDDVRRIWVRTSDDFEGVDFRGRWSPDELLISETDESPPPDHDGQWHPAHPVKEEVMVGGRAQFSIPTAEGADDDGS